MISTERPKTRVGRLWYRKPLAGRSHEVEELVTDVVLFACVVGVVMLGLGVDIGTVIVWLHRRWL